MARTGELTAEEQARVGEITAVPNSELLYKNSSGSIIGLGVGTGLNISGGNLNSTGILFDAIVAPSGGDYTTLGAAITAGKKTIFVRKGTYTNTATITITTNGTTIIGESKKDTIIQFAVGVDGLAQYANNCYVTNLTLDGMTNNSAATYIIGDGKTPGSQDLNIGNNNIVDNCIIKGPNNTFAIYAAGPAYAVGNATLVGFEANGLSDGNIVRNCELHSTWNGDSFSFSLQKDGAFDNNVCYGGRIAFYMCRTSSCSYNKSITSANQGIFVAGPLYDNVITGNTIYNPTSSGIKLQNQLEHTPLLAGQGIIGNTISNNTIRGSGVNAIDINGESANPAIGNTFLGNSVNGSGDHCIYLQYAEKNILKGNILKNPRTNGGGSRGSGIYMVANVIDNTFEGNSIDGTAYHTAIGNREDSTCVGNIVKGNKIKGTCTERTFWFESDETIIEGNSIEGGNFAGIRINNANYCQILGNKLKNNTNNANNSYAEIWLQGTSSFNTVFQNVIRSTASNKAANGINIDGASCVSNAVINNKVYGSIGTAISNTGTTTDLGSSSSGKTLQNITQTNLGSNFNAASGTAEQEVTGLRVSLPIISGSCTIKVTAKVYVNTATGDNNLRIRTGTSTSYLTNGEIDNGYVGGAKTIETYVQVVVFTADLSSQNYVVYSIQNSIDATVFSLSASGARSTIITEVYQ